MLLRSSEPGRLPVGVEKVRVSGKIFSVRRRGGWAKRMFFLHGLPNGRWFLAEVQPLGKEMLSKDGQGPRTGIFHDHDGEDMYHSLQVSNL